MKKFICYLLALGMMFSLVACNGNDKEAKSASTVKEKVGNYEYANKSKYYKEDVSSAFNMNYVYLEGVVEKIEMKESIETSAGGVNYKRHILYATVKDDMTDALWNIVLNPSGNELSQKKAENMIGESIRFLGRFTGWSKTLEKPSIDVDSMERVAGGSKISLSISENDLPDAIKPTIQTFIGALEAKLVEKDMTKAYNPEFKKITYYDKSISVSYQISEKGTVYIDFDTEGTFLSASWTGIPLSQNVIDSRLLACIICAVDSEIGFDEAFEIAETTSAEARSSSDKAAKKVYKQFQAKIDLKIKDSCMFFFSVL